MSERDTKVDEALEGLDEEKRKVLMRLLKGGAFVGPVVASFAMQAILVQHAEAATSNTTGFKRVPS